MRTMAPSLLESVLGETRSLLVQDSSQCNGRLLLKAIALQAHHRCSSVHVFLFDVHPQAWLSGVPHDLRQRLTLHDCCTDHLGWRKGTSPAPLHEATPPSLINELQATPTQTTGCAVVIDSLSTLLHFHSSQHVCRLVHHLGRECGLVVCLLHFDLHDSHVTSQLDHVMSTVIKVNSPPSSAHHYQVGVRHVKTSGKLSATTELVTISNSYDVTSSVITPSTPSHQAPSAPDPTVNLTFDLTLSEREREERGRLVLPYHHSAQKKTALLQAGSGRIFYQPDEADDYDDSDPDDDLDL